MRADSRAGWRRVVPGRLGPEVGAEGGRRPVPGPGVDGPVRGVCRCTKVTNPARSDCAGYDAPPGSARAVVAWTSSLIDSGVQGRGLSSTSRHPPELALRPPYRPRWELPSGAVETASQRRPLERGRWPRPGDPDLGFLNGNDRDLAAHCVQAVERLPRLDPGGAGIGLRTRDGPPSPRKGEGGPSPEIGAGATAIGPRIRRSDGSCVAQTS